MSSIDSCVMPYSGYAVRTSHPITVVKSCSMSGIDDEPPVSITPDESFCA